MGSFREGLESPKGFLPERRDLTQVLRDEFEEVQQLELFGVAEGRTTQRFLEYCRKIENPVYLRPT